MPRRAPADHALPAAVYNDGGICLDILQNQWSPIYDVAAILTSIQARAEAQPLRAAGRRARAADCAAAPQSLLCDPNPNSPANSEAARLYGENRHACYGAVAAVRMRRAGELTRRAHRREYNRKVKEVVEESWKDEGS